MRALCSTASAVRLVPHSCEHPSNTPPTPQSLGYASKQLVPKTCQKEMSGTCLSNCSVGRWLCSLLIRQAFLSSMIHKGHATPCIGSALDKWKGAECYLSRIMKTQAHRGDCHGLPSTVTWPQPHWTSIPRLLDPTVPVLLCWVFIYLGIDIFVSDSIQWTWWEMCLWPLKMTLQSTAFIFSLFKEEIVPAIKSLFVWSPQIKFHLPWLLLFVLSSLYKAISMASCRYR